MEKLKPCPICGAKAYVAHIKIPEADYGWDAGCPRFCLDDDWHGIGPEHEKKHWPRVCGLESKEKAVEAWNRKAAEMAEFALMGGGNNVYSRRNPE